MEAVLEEEEKLRGVGFDIQYTVKVADKETANMCHHLFAQTTHDAATLIFACVLILAT